MMPLITLKVTRQQHRLLLQFDHVWRGVTNPWSYPKRTNPVVATDDTASDSEWPLKPMKVGGAIVVAGSYWCQI
jgi:hypothetical protein